MYHERRRVPIVSPLLIAIVYISVKRILQSLHVELPQWVGGAVLAVLVAIGLYYFYLWYTSRR